MELTKSSGAYVGAKKRNKAVAFPGERNREKPLISPLEKKKEEENILFRNKKKKKKENQVQRRDRLMKLKEPTKNSKQEMQDIHYLQPWKP